MWICAGALGSRTWVVERGQASRLEGGVLRALTTGTSKSYKSRQLLDSGFMMSTSLKANGRWSHTSDSTDRACLQSPHVSREKNVIRQDWSLRPVTRNMPIEEQPRVSWTTWTSCRYTRAKESVVVWETERGRQSAREVDGCRHSRNKLSRVETHPWSPRPQESRMSTILESSPIWMALAVLVKPLCRATKRLSIVSPPCCKLPVGNCGHGKSVGLGREGYTTP